jgi:hypothetical protein
MMIISAFFCMRREATARVLAELDRGATTSKVCFNGRGSIPLLNDIVIRKAG